MCEEDEWATNEVDVVLWESCLFSVAEGQVKCQIICSQPRTAFASFANGLGWAQGRLRLKSARRRSHAFHGLHDGSLTSFYSLPLIRLLSTFVLRNFSFSLPTATLDWHTSAHKSTDCSLLWTGTGCPPNARSDLSQCRQSVVEAADTSRRGRHWPLALQLIH